MSVSYVKCPKCDYPLNAEQYNTSAKYEVCGVCLARVRVYAFPALYRNAPESRLAVKADMDDAVCYYHADKKAEIVCDECGRFLCALCELPLGGESLCAPCLEARRRQPGEDAFVSSVMRYDKIAFYLAVLPLLSFPFTVFTAPATIFVVVRYHEKIKPSARARMSAAFIFALFEIVGWIIALVILIRWIASVG